MKQILLILMLAITSVGVSGCGATKQQQQQAPTTEDTDSKQQEEDSDNKQPESVLGLTTTDTLVHDDSEYVVYVRQTGCPHCANVSPVVKEFSKSHPDIKVYDMNISDFDFFSKPFADSKNENPKLPLAVTDDIKIASVPVVFYVKDGEFQKIGVGDAGPNNAIEVLNSIK